MTGDPVVWEVHLSFKDMFPGVFDSLHSFLVFFDFGGSDFIVCESRVDCA